MDSIEFQGKLSGNIGKRCHVTLKDDKECDGIYTGTYHDGWGHLIMRLEDKGGNMAFGHTEVQDLYFANEDDHE